MAINLNTATYREQFNAFVNFASKHRNPDHVARVGETRAGTDIIGLEGEPRTITAKDWDGAGQVLRSAAARKVNNEVRDLFLKTIISVCNVKTIEELPQSVKDVLKIEDFDGKGHPLTARRIKAVTNAVLAAAGLTEAAGTFAFGNSPAVAKLQHMVMNAPCMPANATPDKKVTAFLDKLRENTAKEIATTIPDQVCEEFVSNGTVNFNKVHNQFAKDLNRDMRVYIGSSDGSRTEVPKDYEGARDKIVQFITGEKNDTFDSVGDSVKRQTGVLMSMLNQCSNIAIMNGFLSAVKTEDESYGFSDFGSTAGTNMDYTLTKKKNGDIQISFSQANGCGLITMMDKTGAHQYFMDGSTSCCRVGMEMTFSSDKLKDVADGDWTELDYNAFKNAKGNDSKIDLVPHELRLDPKLEVTATFELNAALDDPMKLAEEQFMRENNAVKS